MKLAIVGGRDFDNYEKMRGAFDFFFGTISASIEIVSGGAIGADSLAKKLAQDNKMGYVEYLPDWDKYGRSAGFKRNRQIAEYADMILVFWNGKSHGTKNTIDHAAELKKNTVVVYY
jgi:predicted Rossmann fold nucleotide-binding protein DprA/Smf involved in DNA uptake